MDKINKNSMFLLMVLIVFFFSLFFPVWQHLISLWLNSDDNSYGLFIVPISIYIIFQKKDNIKKLSIKSNKLGLVIVVISLLLYIIANFTQIMTLSAITMVMFIFGSVFFIFGYQIVKELIFPLCFLFLLVPVPAQIYSAMTIPLQLFVTKVSVSMAGIFSIPVFSEGNVIHLPDRTLQVVQACSGLRSLVSLLTLAAVYSFFTLKSNILRFTLFFTGFPVAIFVNIFRVLMMIVSFHYFNLNLTEDRVHSFFGMMVFILALIIIAIIGKGLAFWDKSIVKD